MCLYTLGKKYLFLAHQMSSTQAEDANRDAKIKELEDRCEQLEAQVSPVVSFVVTL